MLLICFGTALATYGWVVEEIHRTPDDPWNILLWYPFLGCMLLAVSGLVLFIVYTVQWANHKISSYNPWVLVLFLIVLGVTICTPKIFDWADGPIQYDTYGRPLPD